MYAVTLASLIQSVRQRSNLEGATAFIPDTEIIDYVNKGLSKWYDLVVGSTWGGQYYRTAWPITTASGVASYGLPQNMKAVISVDVLLSGGIQCNAYAYQEEQRNWFKLAQLFGWTYNQPVYYQLQGANIVFAPVPQGAFAATVNYVPVAPILSNSTDTLDSIDGWEEFIILDAAIKCALKEAELDVIGELRSSKTEEEARIRANAPQRDMNQTEAVHETGRWGWED
jgi:hypothetical protein